MHPRMPRLRRAEGTDAAHRAVEAPLLALIFGLPNFENLSFTINNSHFRYGDFINNAVTFVTVAAAMFFLVVTPLSGSP